MTFPRYLLVLIFFLPFSLLAVEPPPGLRPAKAVGNANERGILSAAEKNDPTPPPNARIPPNLSLRSRMIAAQNSAAAASHDAPHEEHDSVVASPQQPVVFNKSSKSKKVIAASKAQVKKTVIVPAENEIKIPRVKGPTPPKGNYGVNTALQTNLVDSQGRVIKGVSAVPIPLPARGEMSKKGQATASQIDNDEDQVVPVKFGRAGDN